MIEVRVREGETIFNIGDVWYDRKTELYAMITYIQDEFIGGLYANGMPFCAYKQDLLTEKRNPASTVLRYYSVSFHFDSIDKFLYYDFIF